MKKTSEEKMPINPSFMRHAMIARIALVCHQVNKTYCESINDHSQVDWELAPEWQKDSSRKGVEFKLDNPNATPKDLHMNWVKDKQRDGWKWGEVKNTETKEHPCLLPYMSLPLAQRTKDSIFNAVVEAMR